MQELVDPSFVYPNLAVADSAALFEVIGSELARAGRVQPSFAQALTDREASYPTGLPVSGGVAIPHTDARHVITDTIAVALLARPISFQAMGGSEDEELQVSTVFVLALGNPDEHVTILPRIVKSLQDAEFLSSLHASGEPDEIARRVNAAFGA